MDEKSRVPGEVGELAVGEGLVRGITRGRGVAESAGTAAVRHVVQRMLLLQELLLLVVLVLVVVGALVGVAGSSATPSASGRSVTRRTGV